MPLHFTSSITRRLAVMTLGWLVLLSNHGHAQSILWSGAREGSVIQLAAGMTSTNLAITASSTMHTGLTNFVFVLERQGNVVLSRTSAPPHALMLPNLSPGKYLLSAMLQSPALPMLGDLSFDISPAPVRPANDDWSQAAIVSTLNTVVAGSNLDATREADEAGPGGGGAGKSIWWAWTASSSGVFTATTAGSSFDTLLGIYAGANRAALASVAVSDDIGPNLFSQATFSATNGVTYYFLVDAVAGSAGGQAQLRLLTGLPPSVVIASPPDGYLMPVASSGQATNVSAAITAADAAGIARVEYWFDGGNNVSRGGPLASPYQLRLTNLFEGHYILTVAASNHAGLVGFANAGLSVISLEPALAFDPSGSSPGKFQLGLTGFKGANYKLQASTNLDAWCGVGTWTNFPGAAKVADTNAAQLQRRFFRATSAP